MARTHQSPAAEPSARSDKSVNAKRKANDDAPEGFTNKRMKDEATPSATAHSPPCWLQEPNVSEQNKHVAAYAAQGEDCRLQNWIEKPNIFMLPRELQNLIVEYHLVMCDAMVKIDGEEWTRSAVRPKDFFKILHISKAWRKLFYVMVQQAIPEDFFCAGNVELSFQYPDKSPIRRRLHRIPAIVDELHRNIIFGITGIRFMSIYSVSDVLYSFIEDQAPSRKADYFDFTIEDRKVIWYRINGWEYDEHDLKQELFVGGLHRILDSGATELEQVQRIVFDMMIKAEEPWMRQDWFRALAGDESDDISFEEYMDKERKFMALRLKDMALHRKAMASRRKR